MERIDYPKMGDVAERGPEDYIVDLYEKLGWDKTSELDPKKISINTAQWKEICDEFNRSDNGRTAGLVWMNYGPSASEKVPYGKIDIADGAMERIGPALTEADKQALDETVQYRYDVEGKTVFLQADQQESNEFLLQSAYDANDMPPDAFLETLRDAVELEWEESIDIAVDDVIENASITLYAGARYDEARDYLTENYSFEPPFNHYFDQNMKVNILLGTETEKDLDFSSIGVMRDGLAEPGPLDADVRDNALTWLVEQQGHTLGDLKDATAIYQKWGFDAAEITHGTFLASVAEELHNFNHAMGSVTVLVELSINDMAKTLDPNVSLTIPKDATVGIFAPWVGGGSTLDIQLEKDLVIPFDKRLDMQIEGAGCLGYTVNNVYGLVEQAWKRPVDISSPIQEFNREKPLDDLMKKAKERSAEKNLIHPEPNKEHRPPEMGR